MGSLLCSGPPEDILALSPSSHCPPAKDHQDTLVVEQVGFIAPCSEVQCVP